MAITWNIDEARATVQAQMDEANRLDGMIDTIAAAWNIDKARATIQAQLVDWDDTSYAHVMAAVDRAAAAIIPQDPGCWADWVVYLLEALDKNGEIETRGYDFYAVLRSLQDAINERKLNGRW